MFVYGDGRGVGMPDASEKYPHSMLVQPQDHPKFNFSVKNGYMFNS